VSLSAPIKTVGMHAAKVEIHEGVTATVTLEVVAS
jgi:ribosomal protein L9